MRVPHARTWTRFPRARVQCDLALLTVADDTFWEGLRALTFVEEIPELQSPVLVAGCAGALGRGPLARRPRAVFWCTPFENRSTFPPARPTPHLYTVPHANSYPVGGDSLSITKGIVSRVCMTRYSQAGRLASLQIDAGGWVGGWEGDSVEQVGSSSHS